MVNATQATGNRSSINYSYIIKDKTSQKHYLLVRHIYLTVVKGSMTTLLESLTALLEYLDLLQQKNRSLAGSRALKRRIL